MNTIRLTGKVLKKDLLKDNNSAFKILLAIPLNMRVADGDTFKRVYSYLSFTLCGMSLENFTELKEGNYIEITGSIYGNCHENGSNIGELTIYPRSIMRGVVK